MTRAAAKVGTIVLLAGARPAGDVLGDPRGIIKPLVEIGGITMLERTFAQLRGWAGPQTPIVVLSNCVPAITDTIDKLDDHALTLREGEGSIAGGLLALMDRDDIAYPMLVTTADNVLVDQSILAAFAADAGSADVAIGVVERATMQQAFPNQKRTWLPFRSGQFSGANLFMMGSPKARRIISIWSAGEQGRKRGLSMLSLFGFGATLAALMRLVDIHRFANRVGKRHGLAMKIVDLPFAKACIDVDSEADLLLASAILGQREPAEASSLS